MSIVKRRGGCVCLRLTAFCVQILWWDQVSTLPTTTCACSVGYCVMTSGKVFRDVIFRYSRRKDTGATHGRHATRYVPWVRVKGHRGPGTGTHTGGGTGRGTPAPPAGMQRTGSRDQALEGGTQLSRGDLSEIIEYHIHDWTPCYLCEERR